MKKLFLQTAMFLTMAGCTQEDLNKKAEMSKPQDKDADVKTELQDQKTVWDDTMATHGNVIFHAHEIKDAEDTLKYKLTSDSSLLQFSNNKIHLYAATLKGQDDERIEFSSRETEKFNFNDNTYTVVSVDGESGIPILKTENLGLSLSRQIISEKQAIRDSLQAQKDSLALRL